MGAESILGKLVMDTTKAAQGLKTFNDEVDEAREHLIAGTKAARDFQEQVGGNVGRRDIARIDRAMRNAALHTKAWALQLMVGHKELDDEAVKYEDILKSEDALAGLLQTGNASHENIVKRMEQEVELEMKRLAYYEQESTMDRVRANAARERIGALEMELDAMLGQFQDQENIAKAEQLVVEEQLRGNKALAEQEKTRLEFQEQINQAAREGRFELEASLRAQQALNIAQQKVAQKRETVGERRQRRRDAQRFRTSSDYIMRRSKGRGWRVTIPSQRKSADSNPSLNRSR